MSVLDLFGKKPPDVAGREGWASLEGGRVWPSLSKRGSEVNPRRNVQGLSPTLGSLSLLESIPGFLPWRSREPLKLEKAMKFSHRQLDGDFLSFHCRPQGRHGFSMVELLFKCIALQLNFNLTHFGRTLAPPQQWEALSQAYARAQTTKKHADDLRL